MSDWVTVSYLQLTWRSPKAGVTGSNPALSAIILFVNSNSYEDIFILPNKKPHNKLLKVPHLLNLGCSRNSVGERPKYPRKRDIQTL